MNASMNPHINPMMLPTYVIVYPGYTDVIGVKNAVAYPVAVDAIVKINSHTPQPIPPAIPKFFSFNFSTFGIQNKNRFRIIPIIKKLIFFIFISSQLKQHLLSLFVLVLK